MPNRHPHLWLNLPLPGAGLILSGRVWAGVAAAVPALFVVTLAIGAALIAAESLRPRVLIGCAAAYAALALVTIVAQAIASHRKPLDETRVRELHRVAAQAYLTDRHGDALTAARELTAIAPHEAGAWRLLAMVASAGGQTAIAARADRRARRIDLDRAA
ncbi:MAG TPA: hypothetical protein VEL07_22135 [Planctomycetota bacterium]|nr:hypothetical protein [Planctomycetota bacterium]